MLNLAPHYSVAGALRALRDGFDMEDLARFSGVNTFDTISIFNKYLKPLCEQNGERFKLKSECEPLLGAHLDACYIALAARQFWEAMSSK